VPRLNCFYEHCRQRFHSLAGKAGVASRSAYVGKVAFVGKQDAASDSVHVSVPGTAGRMLEAHHLTYPVGEFRSGGRAGRLLWRLKQTQRGCSAVL
jgi:hypothetical protein